MALMRLELTGADEFFAELKALEERGADLRPVWDDIGRIWADRQRGIFDSRGRGRWAPLAASTIVAKRRLGEPATPLIAHGSLRSDVSSPTPRYASLHEAIYGPPRGSETIRYGTLHAKGTGRMPQRNPVPKLLAGERRRMLDAIREHVTKGLR